MAHFARPSATQRQALRRLRSSNSAGENPAQLMLRITGLQICWTSDLLDSQFCWITRHFQTSSVQPTKSTCIFQFSSNSVSISPKIQSASSQFPLCRFLFPKQAVCLFFSSQLLSFQQYMSRKSPKTAIPTFFKTRKTE